MHNLDAGFKNGPCPGLEPSFSVAQMPRGDIFTSFGLCTLLLVLQFSQ